MLDVTASASASRATNLKVTYSLCDIQFIADVVVVIVAGVVTFNVVNV